MITAAVISIALMGFIAAPMMAVNLSADSREQNIALFDLKAVADHIAGLPFDRIMDPDYPQGSPLAPIHPHGGVVASMDHLDQERLIVYYYDQNGNLLPLPGDPENAWATSNIPTPFDTPDPLHFRLVVTWRDYQGRTRQEELRSVRTR